MGNSNKLHRPLADILNRPGKVQRALSHAWDLESQPAPHSKVAFLAIGRDAHGASVALRRKSSFSETRMSNLPDFPRPKLFAGQQRFLFGQLCTRGMELDQGTGLIGMVGAAGGYLTRIGLVSQWVWKTRQGCNKRGLSGCTDRVGPRQAPHDSSLLQAFSWQPA